MFVLRVIMDLFNNKEIIMYKIICFILSVLYTLGKLIWNMCKFYPLVIKYIIIGIVKAFDETCQKMDNS